MNVVNMYSYFSFLGKVLKVVWDYFCVQFIELFVFEVEISYVVWMV